MLSTPCTMMWDLRYESICEIQDNSEVLITHRLLFGVLSDMYSASKVVFVVIILAKTGTRSSHQPEGPPRCLDQSGHHTGVLAEHEDKSMLTLMFLSTFSQYIDSCN